MTGRDFFAAGLGAALTLGVVGIRAQCATVDPPRKSSHAVARDETAPAPETLTHDDEAWRAANASLAETVKLTQRRLEQNEAEKLSLKSALQVAQRKLLAASGGAPPRNEFDLTTDDWKELAKEGKVKARYPCWHDADWHLNPDQVKSLGLSPDDTTTVEKAFSSEQAHIAAAIQPGCAKILGSADLASKLGPAVCAAVISQSSKSSGAAQMVANIKAGIVSMPAPDSLDPMSAMMLAQASAMERLNADLSGSFGPEEGHRLAFADEMGSCTSSWGGGPPPKP